MTVTWSGSADYYQVDRRASTSNYWQTIDSYVYTTTFTDTFDRDDPFGWHQYRVTPFDWDGTSGTAGSVSVNVLKVWYPPSVPRSPYVVSQSSTTANVAWSAPTTVDYSCNSDFDYCDPATSYIVSWSAGGTWSRATTTSTRHTISGLRAGTVYYFNVVAVNQGGRSRATTSVRFSYRRPSTMAPMDAYGHNRYVNLYWSPPTDNGATITGYVIQMRRSGSATWSYVGGVRPASSGSYTVSNLTNGVTYQFRILATSAAGWGAFSSAVSEKPYTYASAPTGLYVVSSYSGYTLHFRAPTSNGGYPIYDYRVQILRSSGWVTMSDGVSTSGTSFIYVPGYGCNYLRVAAITSAGVGAYSQTYSCY